MTITTIPAVVYAARSQAEEPGKDSTGDQVRTIRERLDREPDRFIYGEPHTDHASGFHGNRGSGLEAALAAAERAASEHGRAELWVFKSERLARGSGRRDEARSVMEVYVDARRAGVDLRSVEDDEYFTNPMLVGIADAMAHKYSRDLSAHVKRGIAARARTGKPWGPSAAYGYAKRADGHWKIDPAEAATARRMYALGIGEGLSYLAIARLLNAERVPTRHGGPWTRVMVRRVMTDRYVLGEFKAGGTAKQRKAATWQPGEHEAIIDQATWDAAQAIAERNSKYAPKGGGGRLPPRHIFVRGALRCGLCGAAMLPRSAVSGSPDRYVCRTHWLDTAACSMPVMDRVEVDTAALAMFETIALDVQATREHLAGQLDTRAADARTQADRAALDAVEKQAALALFDRDYATGKIGGEDFTRLTADYREQLAAAEAEHARLVAHADRVDATMADLDADGEALHRLADLRVQVAERITDAASDIGALRAAMAAVFDHVSVQPEAIVLDGDAQPVHVLTGGTWTDEHGDPIDEPTPERTEAREFELTEATRFSLVPWLRREAYDGVVYERVEDVTATLAGLPVKRTAVEFEAMSSAENNGPDSPVCE